MAYSFGESVMDPKAFEWPEQMLRREPWIAFVYSRRAICYAAGPVTRARRPYNADSIAGRAGTGKCSIAVRRALWTDVPAVGYIDRLPYFTVEHVDSVFEMPAAWRLLDVARVRQWILRQLRLQEATRCRATAGTVSHVL